MIIILYLSAAVAAIAFLYLVISISKTLKSVQQTLDSVGGTLTGLEKQMTGITTETTALLHKTNLLAEDIQRKSESLNVVVDSVKDVGDSIHDLNKSIKNVSNSVTQKVEANKESVAQVIQWSNVALDIWGRIKAKKQQNEGTDEQVELREPVESQMKRSRSYS
ncbi:DUF948 domain-containing protein [Metabacillus iocasae]|uniref:Uncharacterized protein YoxC n=1 Tax=Priestia iocasae TaxID=2291674 RepID=A0ABS2QP60_9BACI|nr:DUF948 domain-containing protein [Metabacillus iocasae]MBM7701180.1 uncharacterized protein YoxC [Metabacillus iocasae]